MKFPKMYRWCAIFILFTVLLAFNVYAASYPWRDHRRPFDFEFGNHLDSHQQSQVDGDYLAGFFYIIFTQDDPVEGLSVAEHSSLANAEMSTVGWMLNGVPAQGVLIDNSGGDHPLWCLDPEDIPEEQGFTHFHWTGEPEKSGDLTEGETYDGYLLRLTAIDSFWFLHGPGGIAVYPGIDYDSHYNIVTTDNNCEE